MNTDKIVKIFIVIFIFSNIFLNRIKADEKINITNSSQIKYKWYINEIIDETYYLKGEVLDGYYEIEEKVNYGNYSNWDYKYCTYPKEKYVVEAIAENIYKKVTDVQYVKLIGFNYENDIRIFENTKEISYEIINATEKEIIINLKRTYEVQNLIFYVDSEKTFDIYLSFDYKFTIMALYKHIEKEKLLIPDESWIYDKTVFKTEYTQQKKEENAFRKYDGMRGLCRAKEILTYRYKSIKKYYDDNYYEYIEGYLPDYNNFVIEYNGEIPKEIIKITNTEQKVVPVKEYIYIKKNDDIDKSNEEFEPKEIVKNNYIEKEIIKKVTPKKIYIIITILLLIILFQLIQSIRKKKKKVD